MSNHLLVIAIAFASLELARRAVQLIRDRTLAQATAAPLGSLDYDHPTSAAVVAARVDGAAAAGVKKIADELGGLVVEQRPVPDEEPRV